VNLNFESDQSELPQEPMRFVFMDQAVELTTRLLKKKQNEPNIIFLQCRYA